MNEVDYRRILLEVFIRLRSRLRLGIAELLSALRLVEENWETSSLEQLRRDLHIVWCRTALDRSRLDDAWNEVSLEGERNPARIEERPFTPATEFKPERVIEPDDPEQQDFSEVPSQSFSASLAVMPVQPPPPLQFDEPTELNTYWPLSKRSMAYGWRYLRRLVPDGPFNALDIEATVDSTARRGVYLAPVYGRLESNHAHLLLLVDQGGSMVPFHRFTRDLVESAQQSNHFGEGRFEAHYFHNVIDDEVFEKPHITGAVELKQVLDHCDNYTSVLIVSDAGAARGFCRLERVRVTSQFLSRLREHTNLIAWLNPMPEHRWAGTSAQVISHLVPMLQMNPDGFSRAIDVVRGIPLRATR
ncbi:MAG TPA: VWA containing CoxE family protein [Blastocatellia bacterium]|jgi:hypothetical protein